MLPGSGVNLSLHKFEEYPENEKKVRFIIVSRVRKDKGFDEMFDAIKEVSKDHKHVEFHIVGWYEDDNYKIKIDEMVEQYPVIYHGTQTQEKVHELIKGSHCLIHPSHHEGMANVLLEAEAAGRPCIASDIPGCREAIENGKTGFLFKPQNSESLIKAIEEFLQLTHQRKVEMGISGRKKMEAEFDRQIVVQRYLEEISKIYTK